MLVAIDIGVRALETENRLFVIANHEQRALDIAGAIAIEPGPGQRLDDLPLPGVGILRFIDKHDAATLVSDTQSQIAQLLQLGEQMAQAAMRTTVADATAVMLQTQTAEIKRLVALKQVNPNVRDSELAYLKEQTLQLHQCMKLASVELLAVHVVFKA